MTIQVTKFMMIVLVEADIHH
ncbi:hypothetical protein CBM2615_B60071 [Cupriavidus taiwanensis]|uniref:Uncharacterized protein n=1 Tax=Cupriavidus taiwanensis TaxID=164546 RepID=A0A375E9Q1_9BURK|nr:hypothetical protein CBM2614_B50069 [Cupriavidus taiwanensis]SOZ69713.1 hypothetical protein CBM2615_B60071 [Cupriavidus taiwanensis]SOZ72923.1 hypothetical protein CBM2613_B50071 [Cupriavidus taiwanensis]SPA09780.1 hypothetical protein CBM2625_B50069 [Cupriavidus taiwanensis]